MQVHPTFVVQNDFYPDTGSADDLDILDVFDDEIVKIAIRASGLCRSCRENGITN